MTQNRKIAYIDLATGNIETASVPSELRTRYIGGRGLGAYLLYNHLAKGADPLGPDNVIVLSAGLLAGTPGSVTSPLHICTKSPVTGYYESYYGSGMFSAEMRWAGYDHIVIKGKSPKPVYLSIQNKQVTLRDASPLMGKNIAETQALIREDLTDKGVMVVTIGPAGEKMVNLAGVFSLPDETECGAGIGAVMGSKNLKAVAAKGNGDLVLTKPREALAFSHELTAKVTAPAAGRLLHPDVKRPKASVFEPNTQPSASATGYNTVLQLLLDTDTAAMYGLDPVETMNAVAWMINLYEEDVITDDDTGGLVLKWDNTQDILELVRQIAEKPGFTASILDKASETIMKVKGRLVSPAAAINPASALNLVTSSGNSEYAKNREYPDLDTLPEPVMKEIYNKPVAYNGILSADENQYEGKAWQAVWRENSCMAADCFGNNGYYGITEGYIHPDYEAWAKLAALTSGSNMSVNDIWTAAERSLTQERMFNLREGMTPEEENLPQAYYERERLTPSPGTPVDADKLQKMIVQYYTLHGWGNNGIPGDDTLKKLSLDNEPSHRL